MKLVTREITTNTVQLNLYTDEQWEDRKYLDTGVDVDDIGDAVRRLTMGGTFNLYKNVNSDNEYILIRY